MFIARDNIIESLAVNMYQTMPVNICPFNDEDYANFSDNDEYEINFSDIKNELTDQNIVCPKVLSSSFQGSSGEK